MKVEGIGWSILLLWLCTIILTFVAVREVSTSINKLDKDFVQYAKTVDSSLAAQASETKEIKTWFSDRFDKVGSCER